MNRPDEDPVPLRDALTRVGAQLGLPSSSALTQLEARWSDIVGAEMARHLRPAGVRDGVLTVVAGDAAWATQLRYLEADLVRATAAVIGDGVVRAIQVRVAREPPRTAEDPGSSLVD